MITLCIIYFNNDCLILPISIVDEKVDSLSSKKELAAKIEPIVTLASNIRFWHRVNLVQGIMGS